MYEKVFQLHAELFKALAHPRRLEIVQLLRDQELCVSDIYEMLYLPQANISQHLMILRDAGVVITTRNGKQIVYKLASPKIVQACDLIRELLIEQYQGSEIANQLTMSMQDLLPVVHDLVCHMRLSPKTASFHTTYQKQDFYFCASGCSKKFQENPAKYVRA